jgi:muconate cycloisomerase
LAVLDVFGCHFRELLSSVTRLIAPELWDPREWVRYSGAIMSAKGFKAKLAAWVMRLYRFRQVKVKVGMAGHDDPGRLRVIRGRLGRKIDIRVDANESWTPDGATECIRALVPFGITSVEQPVRHEDVACLAKVRQEVSVPVMLDESLCGMVDATRAVQEGLCDLFNLRLSKCGGFIPSLRLAQKAKQHGLGYQLGCQVGETAILSAAGRHFASSVADLRYVEGSYDRHLVREALGKQDLTFGWGGWAPTIKGPGLGVEIDEAALERVTVRKLPLLS